MTHAPDRLAGLVASAGRGPVEPDGATGDDEDLVAGARLRTEIALAAVARAAAVPGRAAPGAPGGRSVGRLRWRIGPRAALVAAGVLVALGGAAAWWWWPAGEPARVVALDRPTAASSAGAGAPSPRAEASGAGVVVVHVVGAVAAPGVVRLPTGSRVTDAVDAAGGPLPEADLAGVNLARVLADGEQVVVPTAGASVGAPAGAPGPGGAAGAGPTTLDLNAADAAALDALPGIGPVLAARIVDWRTEHGRFTSVDELGEVTGIGPSLLAGLRGLVRV